MQIVILRRPLLGTKRHAQSWRAGGVSQSTSLPLSVLPLDVPTWHADTQKGTHPCPNVNATTAASKQTSRAAKYVRTVISFAKHAFGAAWDYRRSRVARCVRNRCDSSISQINMGEPCFTGSAQQHSSLRKECSSGRTPRGGPDAPASGSLCDKRHVGNRRENRRSL